MRSNGAVGLIVAQWCLVSIWWLQSRFCYWSKTWNHLYSLRQFIYACPLSFRNHEVVTIKGWFSPLATLMIFYLTRNSDDCLVRLICNSFICFQLGSIRRLEFLPGVDYSKWWLKCFWLIMKYIFSPLSDC